MVEDVVYSCWSEPDDKLILNAPTPDESDRTVYIAVKWQGSGARAIVLSKEDALDMARRINEAFGDSNA